MPKDFSKRSQHYKSCRSCSERSESCHYGCEDYAKEVILGVLLEALARKESEKRADEYAVREKKALRISKSCPKAGKVMRKSKYMRNRGR